MIYIRVDGNTQIATGHIMRCLAIAKELKECGENCTFILADHDSEDIIIQNGFSTICLESKWNDLDFETDILIHLIEELKINKLIIDSYFVTETYLNQLSKVVKIVYIDDLNSFQYPVDLLINYSLHSDRLNYELKYSHKAVKLLLGSKYVPLRREFLTLNINCSCLKESRNKQVKDILITTGGSDPYNFSTKFLDIVTSKEQYKGINFHVVVGKYNEYFSQLEEKEDKYSNVYLHSNVKKMSELMFNSDIAISAGGTTLFELCACGIPSISFVFADNQQDGARAFGESDIIFYGGDIREDMELVINRILEKIDELIQSQLLRTNYARKMRELIDGKGAKRIAEEVLKL